MSAARFIIGLTIFGLGVFLLLDNFDLVAVNWVYVSQFWPALLIIWGVSLLSSKPAAQYLLALLATLAVLSTAILGVQSGWLKEPAMPSAEQSSLTANYLPENEEATLVLAAGAGTFSFENKTDYLVEANAFSTVGRFELSQSGTTVNPKISISQDASHLMWNPARWGNQKNILNVALHESPVWSIAAHVGAAKNNFDLSNFKIKKFDLDTGASDTTLTLGDAYKETAVQIKAGASKINIRVPKNSGVEIQTDLGASSKSFGDLIEVEEDELWQSANYNEAVNKIMISVNAGASNVKLEQY